MNLKQEFLKTWKSIVEPFDYTKHGIRPKYSNPNRNFARLLVGIKKARKAGKTAGLDFGCGCGHSLVLARLMEMELVGLDIIQNPYIPIQDKLRAHGYRIERFDTFNFPWEFEDSSFDFVVSWFSQGSQSYNREATVEKIRQRNQELVRISAQDALWLVYPRRHLNNIQHHAGDLLVPKNIQLEYYRVV
ncbi:MAG: class I SAM-dependent methyltransferase [Promethearchaeota archaeon]|jgi:hypothetical protein